MKNNKHLELHICTKLKTQHAAFTDTENHKANTSLSEQKVINYFTHLLLLAVEFLKQGDKTLDPINISKLNKQKTKPFGGLSSCLALPGSWHRSPGKTHSRLSKHLRRHWASCVGPHTNSNSLFLTSSEENKAGVLRAVNILHESQRWQLNKHTVRQTSGWASSHHKHLNILKENESECMVGKYWPKWETMKSLGNDRMTIIIIIL